MQSIWLSMRGNAKCVCKHSVEVLNNHQDVLKRDRRPSNETSSVRRSEPKSRTVAWRRSSEHKDSITHFIGKFTHKSIKTNSLYETYTLPNRSAELRKGDTSRNIVEMIYKSAVTKTDNPMPIISKVFKVENSIEMHRRFEKHRETVKKTEFEKKGHPRVMVDGNEVTQFYTTFMQCNGENGLLCKELSCEACKIIRTGFELEKNGVVCSVGMNVNGNGRRCVIVCRTIAGVMGYMNEKIEGCDSIRSVVGSKLDYLIVRNPKAFLPCFVIVFED